MTRALISLHFSGGVSRHRPAQTIDCAPPFCGGLVVGIAILGPWRRACWEAAPKGIGCRMHACRLALQWGRQRSIGRGRVAGGGGGCGQILETTAVWRCDMFWALSLALKAVTTVFRRRLVEGVHCKGGRRGREAGIGGFAKGGIDGGILALHSVATNHPSSRPHPHNVHMLTFTHANFCTCVPFQRRLKVADRSNPLPHWH